jgi:hypothetical protein
MGGRIGYNGRIERRTTMEKENCELECGATGNYCKCNAEASASDSNALLCCPHCGSKEGYYRKVRYYGWGQYNFNYDGSDADNSTMWDSIPFRDSPKAYCSDCDKEIKELRAT